ncbi:MAG: response regulator [Bacteroidales bacterium]|nr:response regulator [Bacteroidales bacterium]
MALKNYVILFILAMSLSSIAQRELLNFSQYNVNNGLSENIINCINQDKQGFIWIGTQNGLNRFDGYEFKVFKHNPLDENTLRNNNIKALLIDNEGYLWVATSGGGISRYNHKTDCFENHCFFKTQTNSEKCNVYTIVEDKTGSFWIGTYGEGLYKFNPKSKKTVSYNTTGSTNKISGNSIRSLCVTKSNTLFVGYETGKVDVIDLKTGKVTSVDKLTHNNNAIMHIIEDASQNIWIGTYGAGFSIYNQKRKTLKNFNVSNSKLNNNVVWKFFVKDNNTVWIATRGGGINIFNTLTEDFKTISYSPDITNGISSNTILEIFKDASGIYWIGTEDKGINTLNIFKQNFKKISPKYLFPTLTSNSVESVFLTRNREIWLGLMGNGVVYYNQENGDKEIFTTQNSKLSNNSVLSINQDIEGNIWFGTDGSGVDIYNPKTKTFRNLSNKTNDSSSLSNNAVHVLFRDSKNNMWLGTYGGGLCKYNKETDNFSIYTLDTSAMNNVVLSIFEDISNNIWVGTNNKGLARLSKNMKFIYSDSGVQGENKLDNMLMSIYRNGDDSLLWVGTGGMGIQCKDIYNNSVISFTGNEGLSNDVVLDILPDKKGVFWVSTINGLNKFDPATTYFKSFDTEDGLLSNVFNHNSSFYDSLGYMYFGGDNGLNIFHPDSISISNFTPPILFTRLQIGYEDVVINSKTKGVNVLEQSINTSTDIVLSHRHNVISIEFAALDYKSSKKIKYQYKLEGLDEKWHTCNADSRIITYTQLSSGNYTLKVRSTNSEGVWCDNIKSLHIKVEPPYWKKSWFILLVALLLILFIYFLIKYNTYKLKKNNKLLEERVAERTKELAEQRDEVFKKTEQIYSQQEEILDQKRLLETKNIELEKFNLAASKADSSIAILNKSGFIEWANECFYKNFDFPFDVLKKEPVNFVIQMSNEVLYDNFKTCIENKVSSSFEFDYKDKFNKRIFTLTSVTPVLSRLLDIETIVLVITDITKQKVTEQQILIQKDQITKQHHELQIHRDNLEKLVEERTGALRDALIRAEESDRLKTSFLANISHEIRTPMNSIIGFSELLSLPGISEEKRKRYLEMISSNGEALVRLIDDIIDLSQIETGQIQFKKQPFSIYSRCEIMLSHLNTLVLKSGKSIATKFKVSEFDKNILLYSDAFRIEQVLLNLLNNAVKYTDKGDFFGFELIGEGENKYIRFFCSDTGIGLQPEQIPLVFKRFTKIEDRKGIIYRGAGLGLSISKHIAELLDGEMWVDSEYGKGSEFYFTIPYKEIIVEESFYKFDFSAFKILIVDDEPVNVTLMSSVLTITNAQLFTASNGQEAIDQYYAAKPDLILMDIKMPIKDGYEATKEIRQDSTIVPIIAVTAYSMQSEKEKIISAGFTNLILKPVNQKNLLFEISKLLNKDNDSNE